MGVNPPAAPEAMGATPPPPAWAEGGVEVASGVGAGVLAAGSEGVHPKRLSARIAVAIMSFIGLRYPTGAEHNTDCGNSELWSF